MSEHYQMERAGWMKKRLFSLSYEQLTRIAEKKISVNVGWTARSPVHQ